MASVNDIGVPGQPMDNPPLTPWQAAVRDVLGGSDVPISQRDPTAGAITPASGWADYGDPFAGLACYRDRGIVTVEAVIKRTSDLAVTDGTVYQIGTLPVGFRPVRDLLTAQVLSTAGGVAQEVCRVGFKPSGAIELNPFNTTTIKATFGWVAVVATFRQGN